MAADVEDLDQLEEDKKIHDWAVGLVEEGEARRLPHEAQWWENIATYAGDLWVEYNIHNKRLEEGSKPDHRVRLPINLAQPAVRTEYAKLLKNRPIVDPIARSSDRADLNAAEVAKDMLNEYGEMQFHKAKVRRRVLQWVLITGYGGIFVDYDPTAIGETDVVVGPDGTPVTDPAMLKAVQRYYREKHKAPKTIPIKQGDLRIKALSPWQLTWDFSQIFVEDAAWVIVSEVYDVDDVYRRWDTVVEGERDAVPGVMERRLMARTSLNTQTDIRTNTRAQDLCRVHRLFVKPGHRYFPNGAEVIFTKDKLIDATEFPHTHGELPVACMGHVFFPISQYPMSVVQAIRPIILEISKTESQMIENRNMSANPPWIEYKQNRIEGEIQNKPGMRLAVNYVPGVPEPHPIQMPDLPGYVKDLVPILKEHVLEVTGQNETSQGQVPAGARSGVAIAYLTEENDTKLGPTVQEYEEMIERASWLELLMYAQYYDAPRTIRISGKKPTDLKVFDFIGSMMEGVTGVKVQAGSALPRSLAAKQQFTMDLYDRGLIRNPRQIMEMLEVGQGEQDEWENDMDQAERENKRMRLGKEAPVLEWYNHVAHLYVHHQFMKSADFEELDPRVQQIFMEHEQEHQAEVRQQQQQQMRDQMMNSGGAGAQGGPSQNGNGPTGTANGVTQPPPGGQFSSGDDIGAVAGSAGPNTGNTMQ